MSEIKGMLAPVGQNGFVEKLCRSGQQTHLRTFCAPGALPNFGRSFMAMKRLLA